MIPVLFTDSEAAPKLTKTQMFHRRTRQIEPGITMSGSKWTGRKHLIVQGIKGKDNPAEIGRAHV